MLLNIMGFALFFFLLDFICGTFGFEDFENHSFVLLTFYTGAQLFW